MYFFLISPECHLSYKVLNFTGSTFFLIRSLYTPLALAIAIPSASLALHNHAISLIVFYHNEWFINKDCSIFFQILRVFKDLVLCFMAIEHLVLHLTKNIIRIIYLC